MNLNVDEIFERLLKTYKTKQLKDLSLTMGYRYNWATSTKNRGAVPWEACAKAANEKNVSMDYLIFGESKSTGEININDLNTYITEGLFSSIQTDLINLNEGVKISHVVKAITDEIESEMSINDNSPNVKQN